MVSKSSVTIKLTYSSNTESTTSFLRSSYWEAQFGRQRKLHLQVFVDVHNEFFSIACFASETVSEQVVAVLEHGQWDWSFILLYKAAAQEQTHKVVRLK